MDGLRVELVADWRLISSMIFSLKNDVVRTRASMQTYDDAYTSDNRLATSPTLSFTTGVIGAKDCVLIMAPEAAGPLPFVVATGIVFANCGGEEGRIGAPLRFPPRSYLSLTELDACITRGSGNKEFRANQVVSIDISGSKRGIRSSLRRRFVSDFQGRLIIRSEPYGIGRGSVHGQPENHNSVLISTTRSFPAP